MNQSSAMTLTLAKTLYIQFHTNQIIRLILELKLPRYEITGMNDEKYHFTLVYCFHL